jgi:ribonuclease P protein component
VQRLKTRPQFQAVLAGGVVARTEHFVLHRNRLCESDRQADPKSLQEDSNSPACSGTAHLLFPVQDVWIGAMVPKRWARRAVTRNAIKRQIYTVSADFLHHYPQAVFLVRLRREFSRKEFFSATSVALKEAVRAEITDLMRSGAVPI